MTTAWRRWAGHDARTLIEYVQRRRQGEHTRGTPADLLGTAMPAPGVGPPLDRARALYEAFAALGVQYADEPTTSDPGRQTVRPPDQVLSRPRHGTCLDLAVAFAGACLDAGLHPLIVVLAGARPGDPAHALVAVWLDGNWSNRAHRDYRGDEEDPDWNTLPPDFTDLLAEDETSGGAFAAVDITGVAARADALDPRRRVRQTWDQSVAYGAQLLREAAEDRWTVTLDVGLGYGHIEPHPLPHRPTTDVLAPPYLPVPQDEGADSGPLRLLWARHDAIRFHPRDELDFLRDWFQAPDPLGPRTRIALLHGVGGAGKTRLAAELAHQLAGSNWYAGFLVRDPDPQDRAWLSEVESPLLVVVDYVEDRKSADVINVLRTLRHRTAPTCLLLTARTVSGWWEEEIAVALKEDGHPYVLHDSALAARHPRQTGVYRAALRSFGGSEAAALGHQPPPDPNSGRWTTLDLVMLAWLDAQPGSAGKTPESEEKLYERILDHELGYWVRAYQSQIGKPSQRTKAVLREAGACLSLVAPTAERLDHSLSAIGELAKDAGRRDQIAALFADLLPSTPEDGTLAVRPDPLGSHLAASVFGADHALLRDCLRAADERERLNACVSVSRFSRADGGSAATDIAHAALRAVPDLWSPALGVAATQGGVFIRALERLATAQDTPLPLAELAATVPTGHSTLRGLALIATESSKPDDYADPSEAARMARAVWLNNLSVRQSDTGDHTAALASNIEAVELYRTLADEDPATFLTYLAGALNNLSNRQSESGDSAAALASGVEGVRIRRALARDNPGSFLPELASSLNNLAIQQSSTGDRTGALASITEAVRIRRALAEEVPEVFRADLASSLNNLAIQQSETGDRAAALASSTEAVQLYRTLTEKNAAAFLFNLAGSLNNLANQQSDTGDRRAALRSISEAVRLYRTLADESPAAFLPALASSLNNLSNQQSNTGDRPAALRSITEAVEHYRGLTRANPAYRSHLASSLNNLSVQESNAGQFTAALASITEAVGIRRTLADENPAAAGPDLAGSLNNLANRQSETGDLTSALASSIEAVTRYRALAEDNPAAFRPDLASALNNLSIQQGNTGLRRAALASSTAAVRIYRALAEDNPAAFRPDLAGSLNNLAVQQSSTGDHEAALATTTEAVLIRRVLAEENPEAFLPELGSSLNNLAVQRSNIGDRAAALAASAESVRIYRALAHRNSVFRVELAGSLNNLAAQQGDVRDFTAALAAGTEAVQLYRALAGDNPVLLPDLSASLNNLSIQQSHTGDIEGALASSAEAVRLYRSLVPDHPVFRADLAGSLNNLSIQQSNSEDHEAALASITEAVGIRRALAADTVFLPDLAGSLNSLSNRQSNVGDHEAALVSVTEAVRLYRTLSRGNRVFLPRLGGALNNLAIQQTRAAARPAALASSAEAVRIFRTLADEDPTAFLPELISALTTLYLHGTDAGHVAEALRLSEAAVAGLPTGSQAELLVLRARWRLSLEDHAGAAADLRTAVERAAATTEPAWAGRSRRAVRGLVAALGQDATRRHMPALADPDLPRWAKDGLPDEATDLFNDWLAQTGPMDQIAFIRRRHQLLTTPETLDALGLARSLYPESHGLVHLATVLRLAAEQGLEPILEELRTTHARMTLIGEWLATRTWQDDLEFLTRHPELTADPRVRYLLGQQAVDDPTSHQHLAILQLAELLPVPDVYDAVTDPATAHDTAVAFIEEGRPEALHPLLAASPALTSMPFTGAYLLAVHLLFDATPHPSPDSATDPDPGHRVRTPAELMARAAQQASEVQRGAGAARLRRLAQRRPEQAPALLELADLLGTAPPQTPAEADPDRG
ncbi:hypothetical protein ACFWUQ_07240 [Streptomyces sp. NPDC058662]|uniref:hypothetical protein n=1 Tax=Streptomyces sp. NPDC058662 TaxID=3346583 RepID=UPI0036481915